MPHWVGEKGEVMGENSAKVQITSKGTIYVNAQELFKANEVQDFIKFLKNEDEKLEKTSQSSQSTQRETTEMS